MNLKNTYFKSIYHLAKYPRFRNFVLNRIAYIKGKNINSILIRLYRPVRFLEIGVGRGKTVKKFLFESNTLGMPRVEYFGFDTFDQGPPTDETEKLNTRISKAEKTDNYWQMHHTPMESIYALREKFKNVECEMKLYKGNTKETLPAIIPQLPPMDFVYIDGGHSYNTVKSDYDNIKPILKTGTAIVFDDFNCEQGISRFIGELLSENGGHFKCVMFLPGIIETWRCSTVLLEYNEEEIPHR